MPNDYLDNAFEAHANVRDYELEDDALDETLDNESSKTSWVELILICCLLFGFIFASAKAYDSWAKLQAIENQESIR